MPRIDIPFVVENQTIKQTPAAEIAAGGKNYFYATFALNELWDDIENPKATFARLNESAYIMPLTPIDGGYECEIPWEVMKTNGMFSVGVFGGDRLNTDVVFVKVICGCDEAGEAPKPPTPDWFNSVDEKIAELQEDVNEIKHISEEDVAEQIEKAQRETKEVIDALESELETAEKRITNLEHQVSPEYFLTDDTVAYEKAVPTNACPYAQLGSIGGMTYKSNNLIPFPYKDVSGTEMYGLTFTYDDNGVITISGTVSEELMANAIFGLCDTLTLPVGTYTLSGFPSGSGLSSIMFIDEMGMKGIMCFDESPNTFTLEEEVTFTTCGIEFDMNAVGQEINATIRPMLNVGSTALPFEPYIEGFVDTPVTEIKSTSGNLANIDVLPTKSLQTGLYNHNGTICVTISTVSDGVTAASKLGGRVTLRELCPEMVAGEKYTLSANTTGSAKYIYFNGASSRWDFGKSLTITDAQLDSNVVFYASGKGTSATITDFMVNRGAVALPFVPYDREFNTCVIPEAILTHDGYGRGVELCSNEVDIGRGKFIRRVKTIGFTGEENWTAYNGTIYMCNIADRIVNYNYKVSVCDRFVNRNKYDGMGSVFGSPTTAVEGTYSEHTSDNRVFFKTSFTTLKKWTTYLAEQYAAGTPVTLVYAVVAPEEEDISDKLGDIDTLIEVSPGGTLVFENEGARPAHSNVTYMLEEGTT